MGAPMPPIPQGGCFEALGKDPFTFACHPKVPCFNECCRKLTLVLTPYDLLRLKKRLGMTSGDFIDEYCEVEPGQNGWPQARLKMLDNERQTCPFVRPQGCSVYEDRPGACRTYPLGRAALGGTGGGPSQESYFLVREDHCRGFEEGRDWSPQTWTQDQGLEIYNEINDMFLPLITRQATDPDPRVITQKMRMFFMACYNLDAFRGFVGSARFCQTFEVPPERLEAIRADELELLKFAFDWLKFSIFGERTLTLSQVAQKAAESQNS